MHYRLLGRTDLSISELALGTMTFGEQNSPADACTQLDRAVAAGVNFIDAAEMYPVPARAETTGRTEDYIGRWLKHRARDQVILASKVTGPGRGFAWIRGGAARIDHAQVKAAVEASLQRLQTDYIDLYQIHWPDRNVPLFGAAHFDPEAERESVPMPEQLAVFGELVQAGKIRYFGVSNETPWGLSQFLRAAEQSTLPRVASIQNAYNLINRTFELTLAETSFREHIPLLAYSPLGFGMLTGKYARGESGRISLFPGFGQRYAKPNVPEAAAAYVALAKRYQMSPAHMALAFVRSRPFVGSTLIGATTPAQLEENLASVTVSLPPELLGEIDAVHARYPNPAP